jgi:hypothetical protein
MRVRAAVLALMVTARVSAAGPETPQLTHSETDRENEVRLRVDQQKLDDLRRARVHKQREDERNVARAKIEADDWERLRDISDGKRSAGVALVITGVALGGVAIAAGVLGKDGNNAIKHGELGSVSDINDTLERGKIYNDVGIGATIAGSLFIAGGIAKILLNLDPGEFQIAPTASQTGAGVAFSGSF